MFEPEDFSARLAALGPRSRAQRVRYHGLLVPTQGLTAPAYRRAAQTAAP
ncbi:MAG: hypothetical protein GKR94_31885 [Gammaproteobacteria bacterium]|nr:hypothetical protein [Gammaproteobacteria bacterium]